MSSDDNLYRAPRSSLQTTAQDDDLTPAAQGIFIEGGFLGTLAKRGVLYCLCFCAARSSGICIGPAQNWPVVILVLRLCG